MFKVGDIVTMPNTPPFSPHAWGQVKSIDGHYITVRLLESKREVEVCPNELRMVEGGQEWAERVKKECEDNPHPCLILPYFEEVSPITKPTGKIFKWRLRNEKI